MADLLMRRPVHSANDHVQVVSNPMVGAMTSTSRAPPAEAVDTFGYITPQGFWVDCHRNFLAAAKSSITNRYLAANIVYVAYAMLLLYLDYTMEPAYTALTAGINTSSSSTDPAPATKSALQASSDALAQINRVYLGAASLHIANAFMYIWVWWPLGYRWDDWIMIPEYLNVIGATLYLATATYYPQTNDLYSSTTNMVHVVETVAAWVEMAAAIGWLITWWATYPRTVGRGLTLDDPDVWANILLILPSVIYITYNIQILQHPDQYGSNFLYTVGDCLYGAGAWMYVLGALRDDGWFWWAPLAGRLPYFPRPIDADDVPCPPRPLPEGRRTFCAHSCRLCDRRRPALLSTTAAPLPPRDHDARDLASSGIPAGSAQHVVPLRRGDSERWPAGEGPHDGLAVG